MFRALIATLPRRPRVQAVVSDFEAAVWSAAREVLPGVLQHGCAFHFSHAVWRNIQAVGLQCAYLQTSLPTSSKPCILRPTTRGLHSICSTWSAVHGAPVDQLHRLAAYYLVSLPSAGADQQRRGGLALSTERQGKSRPDQLIQVDSVAVRRSCTCTA